MVKVAILVDGGFYKKRAHYLFGEKTPEERTKELITYCMRHLKQDEFYGEEKVVLYRIFYYDCPPSSKNITHPLTGKTVNLERSQIYKWSNSFFDALCKKRKVAIRKGELLESSVGYVLRDGVLKKLCNKTITIDQLEEKDFKLEMQQKGVDMRIGLDIASLANKKLVDTIVLIAGDSDFVPAAKHARREGIDFILDPMHQAIKPSLMEHIDGIHTPTNKPGSRKPDKLCKKVFESDITVDAFTKGLNSKTD